MSELNGVSKITDEIISLANKRAEEIISAANSEAERLIKQAEDELAREQKTLDEDFERQCADIREKRAAANRQNRRRALLYAQNEVIDEVIQSARREILSLPATRYFELLFSLYQKNAQQRDGVLSLSAADCGRMTAEFTQGVKALYPDNTLEIRGDLDKANGGFVLSYGDIIHNCTLDDIFETQKQALRDKAYQTLTEG